ncbi:queuosine precursor transporter [Chloroflexota bacterium]
MTISPRLLVIACLFVACLLAANVIAVKLVSIWGFTLPAAVVVFPLSYIFGDILTEVYGYRYARRVIWLGFLCNLVFVLFAWVGEMMPAAPGWPNQAAYEDILGYAPRLLAASFAGYLVGEFVNSYILAKMKIKTGGRWLWARTIGSTVVGQGLDTSVFIIIAYAGQPWFDPITILHHWTAKTAIEAAATPITYRVVNYLKRKEGIDTYDYDTKFNPILVAD